MFPIIHRDIKVVPTVHSDLQFVLAAEQENSEFVFSWSQEKHLEAMEAEDCLHLTIRAVSNDRPLGYIILAGVKSLDHSLEFMRLVVMEKGKGFGRQAVQLVKRLCFEELKFHRLWLDVFADNKKAIQLYFEEGFVQEGLLRECKRTKTGYRSMVLMSMLEQEYAAIPCLFQSPNK